MKEELGVLFIGLDNKVIEAFINGLSEIVEDKSLSLEEYKDKIAHFLKGRKITKDVDDAILTSMGNHLIINGEYKKGIVLLQSALTRVKGNDYADGITLFLRLAEYEFEHGSREKGIEYLMHVCEEEADNYVEAIVFRDLTEVWEKYKSHVEGKVRESLKMETAEPMSPEDCSMQIADILNIEDENEQLLELSTHLQELSADGEQLNCLNNWERKIFYVDQLWMEVNSGGFGSYLYYNGNYFDKAKKACEEMGMEQLLTLLDQVERKFPKSKVSKKLEKIQDIIDDKDLEFDEIDEMFYENVEKEMFECLIEYVKKCEGKLR